MNVYHYLKLLKHTPSSDLADAEDGQLIERNGKRYILAGRDPWAAYLIRWFWWDHLIYRLKQKLRRKQQTS